MSKVSSNPFLQFLHDKKAVAEAITLLQYKIRSLQMLNTDIAAHLSAMPRSASPDQQRMETIIAKIDEAEEELAKLEQKQQKLHRYLGDKLLEMRASYTKIIMIDHYLDGKSLTDICKVEFKSKTAIEKTLRKGQVEMNLLMKDYLADIEALPA